MEPGDKVPRTPKAHRVEVDDSLKDVPVSGFRHSDRPGIHRDKMGQPTAFQQDMDFAKAQVKQQQKRARAITEFAKTMPYTYAEAREECGPDMPLNAVAAYWARVRWELAIAMVDAAPDFGPNVESSE